MPNGQALHDRINAQKEALKDFRPELLEITANITANIKHPLFEWQEEALKNLLTYQVISEKKGQTDGPTHLMFNMATCRERRSE